MILPSAVVVFLLAVRDGLPLVPARIFAMDLGFALAGMSALELAAIFPMLRDVRTGDRRVSVGMAVPTSLLASVVRPSTSVIGMRFVAPGAYLVVPESRGLSNRDLLLVFEDDRRHICDHFLRVYSVDRIVEKD